MSVPLVYRLCIFSVIYCCHSEYSSQVTQVCDFMPAWSCYLIPAPSSVIAYHPHRPVNSYQDPPLSLHSRPLLGNFIPTPALSFHTNTSCHFISATPVIYQPLPLSLHSRLYLYHSTPIIFWHFIPIITSVTSSILPPLSLPTMQYTHIHTQALTHKHIHIHTPSHIKLHSSLSLDICS